MRCKSSARSFSSCTGCSPRQRYHRRGASAFVQEWPHRAGMEQTGPRHLDSGCKEAAIQGPGDRLPALPPRRRAAAGAFQDDGVPEDRVGEAGRPLLQEGEGRGLRAAQVRGRRRRRRAAHEPDLQGVGRPAATARAREARLCAGERRGPSGGAAALGLCRGSGPSSADADRRDRGGWPIGRSARLCLVMPAQEMQCQPHLFGTSTLS
mmetsp:Transcript_28267/g.76571  ORF Transcript_28267/g.76571 Transcript_28267/m.76571 type:complete len:208 (+) Transcript_28267:391-1014(+)